MMENTGQKN